MELSSVQSNYISVTLKQKTYLICQSFLSCPKIGCYWLVNCLQCITNLAWTRRTIFQQKKMCLTSQHILKLHSKYGTVLNKLCKFHLYKNLTAKQVPTEMIKDSIKSSKFASNRENICVRTHTQLRHHNSHFIYQRTYFLHAGSECRIQNAKI